MIVLGRRIIHVIINHGDYNDQVIRFELMLLIQIKMFQKAVVSVYVRGKEAQLKRTQADCNLSTLSVIFRWESIKRIWRI